MFLKLGSLLAWLCTIFGAVSLAIARWIASSFESHDAMVVYNQALRREVQNL